MNKKTYYILFSLIFILVSCSSYSIEPTPQATSTEIPTPSIPTSTPIVYPNYQSGEVICHNNIDEFAYAYCSYVPKSLTSHEKAYILLEASHIQSDDYDEIVYDAKRWVRGLRGISEQFKYIILTPAIPRNFEKRYYPQGINEYSLDSTTPEFYYRPDRKVNLIIDQFQEELKEAGYSVQK